MMFDKNQFFQFSRLVLFTLIFMLACAMQTSFFPFVTGSLPAPQLWLIIIIYIILKWPLYTGIFFTYFLGFVFTFYSYTPLKMIWISLNILYMTVWIVKNRVNSNTLLSFATFVTASNFLFTIIFFTTSQLLESNSTSLFPIYRLVEYGMTFITSIPMYIALSFVDHLFSPQRQWSDQSSSNKQQDDLA